MFGKDLALPESQRDAFKEPLGRELPESELASNSGETVYLTVGDVVSLTFRRCGVTPRLSIYDGFTERREMTDFARLVEDEPKETVVNPAGTITAAMADAVRRGIGGEVALIRVDGEEDLAVLPCLVLAPDGARVVYGMPGRCMMVVEVDGRTRDRAKELLSKMEELE
ncbi:MAG: GTP-dependent dephospho-CoA kinase family protein [Thermoplasmata archaeon]|nr:GTP-dependent dephospho-CoA kinase family protein [Thermoplasmata archaeon]